MSNIIPTVAATLWNSAPVMYAVLTIFLFIGIRMFSRAPKTEDENCKIVKSVTKKVGKKVNETANTISDSFVSAKKELTGEDSTDLNLDDSSNELDMQAYGELFIAALASGFIVKYGW